MRINLILIIFVLLFGVYILIHQEGEPICSDNKVGLNISVEKIDNKIVEILPIREINFFETDKDISNWFIRGRNKDFIQLKRANMKVTEGNFSMEIRWNSTRWGELVLVHFPENWNSYRQLCLDVFNPNPGSLKFEINVGDKFDNSSFYPEKNRFVEIFTLEHGLNKLRIDIEEISDVIKITAPKKTIHLRFFDTNKIFFVDNMRLEA